MHEEFLYSEKSFRDLFAIGICHSQFVSIVNPPFQLLGEQWARYYKFQIYFEALSSVLTQTCIQEVQLRWLMLTKRKFSLHLNLSKTRELVGFPQLYFSTPQCFGAMELFQNHSDAISPFSPSGSCPAQLFFLFASSP